MSRKAVGIEMQDAGFEEQDAGIEEQAVGMPKRAAGMGRRPLDVRRADLALRGAPAGPYWRSTDQPDPIAAVTETVYGPAVKVVVAPTA
jgi:hypothetical protein